MSTENALKPVEPYTDATLEPAPSRGGKNQNPFVTLVLAVLVCCAVVYVFYATISSTPPKSGPQPVQTEEKAPVRDIETEPVPPQAALQPAPKPAAEPPKAEPKKISKAEFEKLTQLANDALNNHKSAEEYYLRGDYANALSRYQRAMHDFEQLLPFYEKMAEDKYDNATTIKKNLAATYNAIGEVCRNQKKYSEALTWLNKALDIREKIQGKDHPDTAETYNNIGLVYENQGQYDKALEWYRKDLAISEKTLGSDHPETAKTYNNIGMVYFRQGDRTNALEWFNKALAIQEKSPTDGNPSAAMTYNNIAEVYRVQGDYVVALPEYLKAYRILRNTFGERNSTTRAVRLNLARAYDKSENAKPFAVWLEESLQ